MTSLEPEEPSFTPEEERPLPQAVSSAHFTQGLPLERAQEDEEAALVRRVQHGEAQAFERLYTDHLDLVYRYIYRRVESVSEAESLTAETFTRGLEALLKGHYSWQGKRFGAW